MVTVESGACKDGQRFQSDCEQLRLDRCSGKCLVWLKVVVVYEEVFLTTKCCYYKHLLTHIGVDEATLKR